MSWFGDEGRLAWEIPEPGVRREARRVPDSGVRWERMTCSSEELGWTSNGLTGEWSQKRLMRRGATLDR